MFFNYIIYVIDLENEYNLNRYSVLYIYLYASHNTRFKVICYFGDVVILKQGDFMIKSNFSGF